MMGDTMRRVQPGSPVEFPAAAYNRMLDLIQAFDGSLLGGNGHAPTGLNALLPGTLYVKNISGSDVARFGVLGIDSPIFTPTDNLTEFQNRPSLVGSTPALASHLGKFAVMLEPAATGKIAPACIGGVAVVKVNVLHASHGFADIKAGDATQLQSGPSGAAAILWKESGAGTKWAIVRIGVCGPRLFWANITGSAALGGSSHRWKYAWSEVVPSGDTIATVTGGRSGTTGSGYALNRIEHGHGSTYAWGTDVTADDYTATGFAPRPVGGGGDSDTHKYNVLVQMEEVVDAGGNVRYWFSAPGSHDGGCTA